MSSGVGVSSTLLFVSALDTRGEVESTVFCASSSDSESLESDGGAGDILTGGTSIDGAVDRFLGAALWNKQ